MFVSEASRKSSPKVLYGILARSALDQLNKLDAAHLDGSVDETAYFQNLVRLLDLYRTDALHRPMPKAVLDRRPVDLRSLKQEKAEATAVEQALSRARASAFPNVQKDVVIERLRTIFVQICTEDAEQLSEAEIQSVKKFLKALVSELKQ
jgi:hypothetical protein